MTNEEFALNLQIANTAIISFIAFLMLLWTIYVIHYLRGIGINIRALGGL
jgi:hypothetical protein